MNKILLAGPRLKTYERLQKKLSALPPLAQGSVFALEPSPGASRAAPRYMWTRKVKNKTVTRALSREQYEALREAIEANREAEKILGEMRVIAQEAILKSLPDSPGRQKRKKRPKAGLS